MLSDEQKNHVTHNFDHLDVRNIMVPLIIPSESCDVDTGANGVTCPKSHVVPHFDHLDLRNAMALLMAAFTSCDASASTNIVT